MRPILLKVAGLQSYREMQEIDFTVLTETGLFVFSANRQRKSSLLDAITPAMYGKVERAVNGTQGIMNHAEDSLSVALHLSLLWRREPEDFGWSDALNATMKYLSAIRSASLSRRLMGKIKR